MIMESSISEKEIMKLKEHHVLRCFTDYVYHQNASSRIQEELDNIAEDLSTGKIASGMRSISHQPVYNPSPWQNELLAREQLLIQAQNEHEKEMEQVAQWVANIKNEHHRQILIDYLIKYRCEHAELVANHYYTTKGNVCKIAHRYVKAIAKTIA